MARPNCSSAAAMPRPKATLLPRPLPSPRSNNKWRRGGAWEELEWENDSVESKELSVEVDASLERSSGSLRLLLRALLRLFSSPSGLVVFELLEAVLLPVPSMGACGRGTEDGLSRSKPNCSKERLKEVVLGGRESSNWGGLDMVKGREKAMLQWSRQVTTFRRRR